MDFADLVAPLTPEQFMAEYWGKRPVHLPAQPGRPRPGMVGWDRLNALLRQRLHWDADHLKLVMNSRGVAEDHYLDEMIAFGKVRHVANPAKVEALLGMGASLVANEVQDAAPEIRELTDALGWRFAARASGNLYASFQGVQAFASHFDTHEVFAIHGEGEKRWRLYTNRAENPVETPEGEGAQATLDAAKGPVSLDVVMRPGDVLYIPRGWMHDAIASAGASLHLTVGVLPHTAQILFRLLEQAAMQDPLFRAYLPDARADDGKALGAHLAALAERLGAIATSPALREDVAVEQARSVDPGHALALPNRPTLTFYARTDRPYRIVAGPAGKVLQTQAGEHPLGGLREVADYMMSRPGFSVQEVSARFLHHPAAAVATLAVALARLGLIERYTPAMG